ncbi:uncharacterized protein BJ171DRAFT_67778 [Polychytrium aggregatum]|uniref:uncharacterized protein n=1 Tax=Polychytrium aggregatum TaxID=110093 RepID=UPI0022FE1968|nr:uncharacterized protein BJ171DRAFT_67778 [Polychytrium aggregatum]KAI9190713.1 hypothetical protein BJ171DRAFT_67778 [Polychytrium aggregatum]
MMDDLTVSNAADLQAMRNETVTANAQYSDVFWVNCSTETTALEDLGRIFPGIKPNKLREHAAETFSSLPGYLLIIDNVDDISVVDFIFDYNKQKGFRGDVVLATRLASLPLGSFLKSFKAKITGYKHDPLRLGGWDGSTARKYITSSSPLIGNKLASDEAKKSLDNIVSKANGCPLVIEIVAAYLESHDTALSVLGEAFAKAQQDQSEDDKVRLSLETVVDLSLDSLMKRGIEGVEAIRLFGALSLVAPTDIQLNLIQTIAQKLELKTDAARLIDLVTQSGLLRIEAKSRYSTHSLTQQIAREYIKTHNELGAESIEDLTGEALLLLTESLGLETLQYFEHLEQLAIKVVPDRYTKETHVFLESRVGELAQKNGSLRVAIQTLESNLKRTIEFRGTEQHIDIIHILSFLADARGQIENLDGAEEAFNRAVAMADATDGLGDDLQTALTLRHLGSVAFQRGKHDKAAELLQQALDRQIKIRGSRAHPDVADTLDCIGNVKKDQGKCDEAEKLHREAVDIRAKSLDTLDHPEAAPAPGAALSKGDYDAMSNYFQKSLELQKDLHPSPHHPSIATSLEFLDKITKSQGRYKDAPNLYKRTEDIGGAVRDPHENIDVATIATRLGQVASAQKDFNAAERYYQEAVDIRAKSYGTRVHPEVATAIDKLGDAALSKGDYEAAVKYFQESLDIKTQVYDSHEHGEIRVALQHLSQAAASLGDYETVLKCNKELADREGKINDSKKSPLIAVVPVAVQASAIESDDQDTNVKDLQEMLKNEIKIHGTKWHKSVAQINIRLGNASYHQGQYEAAHQYFQEALNIVTRITGREDHPDTNEILAKISLVNEMLPSDEWEDDEEQPAR